MRVGDLFSGIGGFALAAQRVGWQPAWFSEIDPHASVVLAERFPGVPNYGDITKVDFRRVEPVGVLCGGFPCQDVSIAGRKQGLDGAKSGLWYECERAIDILRPAIFVGENVSALLVRGLDRVLGSLHALGYDAEWHCIPAAYVGAPHRRDRAWIIAYPKRQGLSGPLLTVETLQRPSRASFPLFGDTGADAWDAVVADCQDIRARDGISPRLDGRRLHALGNAIVPQVAEAIFRAIQEKELT